MKLSTKGRYAVSAMFDLACYGDELPISAAEIAKRQKISLSYLEQLLLKLKRRGLIKSTRGPSGGYILAKKPKQISLKDILCATDGPIALSNCVSGQACSRSGCCSTRSLWHTMSKKVAKLFEATSLADLCKEAKK